MLKRIVAYTVATPTLDPLVDAYRKFLGFEIVHAGKVSKALAHHWRAPAAAGRRYALLSPGGGKTGYLRVVETHIPQDYKPYYTYGWAAAELIVQDVDALAIKLADSAFRTLRPPADLSFTDRIRAMQVMSPGGEVLYLTQFKGQYLNHPMPVAEHFVDHAFIVILSGSSMADMQEWYGNNLGTKPAPSMPVVISAMSIARELPLDTRYELAALQLDGAYFLELDVMPPGTVPRTALPGELKPGICIASFEVAAIPDALAAAGKPVVLADAPYNGSRALLLEGPAGELVELIEGPRT